MTLRLSIHSKVWYRVVTLSGKAVQDNPTKVLILNKKPGCILRQPGDIVINVGTNILILRCIVSRRHNDRYYFNISKQGKLFYNKCLTNCPADPIIRHQIIFHISKMVFI